MTELVMVLTLDCPPGSAAWLMLGRGASGEEGII
jgi:hypothetical protein